MRQLQMSRGSFNRGAEPLLVETLSLRVHASGGKCQADKSAVNDAVEHQGAEEALLWGVPRENCVASVLEAISLAHGSSLSATSDLERCQRALAASNDRKRLTERARMDTGGLCNKFASQAKTGNFKPDQVRVHCRCEMPYNPDEWMVECEKCYEWYASHPSPNPNPNLSLPQILTQAQPVVQSAWHTGSQRSPTPPTHTHSPRRCIRLLFSAGGVTALIVLLAGQAPTWGLGPAGPVGRLLV